MAFTDEQIDEYINGTLPEPERRSMEAALMTDKNWANYVAEYTSFTERIESTGWWQWEQALSEVEHRLENQGFFLTDDELDDYLWGVSEPEITEQIERQRFMNADFSQRIETLSAIKRAMQYVGRSEWDKVLDNAEANLQKEDFFEQTHEPIFEKMPQPMSPVIRALITVGILLLIIIILRFIF